MLIEDKLYQTRFNVDKTAHIVVDLEICQDCAEKPCLYVCPAQNYTEKDGGIGFSWQGCLECGACRLACRKGAVRWSFPRGGFGVVLRYG
jgi:ferredoxin like protein